MATTTVKPINLLDHVRSWSDEEKEAVFVELIEEGLRRFGGDCWVPIVKPNGESLGHYVPPGAENKREPISVPQLTPEQQERRKRVFADLDNTFDVQEYLDQLSREDRD